jgi:hypothetical protein
VTSLPALAGLDVGGPAKPWRKLGFAIADDRCRVGEVELCFHPDRPSGLHGWSLRGLTGGGDLDGIPTAQSSVPPAEPAAPHPNGVERIDHVVVASPRLDRTLVALEHAGLRVRRVRSAPPLRQAFLVAGEVLLEVVGDLEDPAGADAPARLWGVTFVVEDLEALAGRLGEALGPPHDAVQPGRRIATVREDVGLGLPVAFMTPRG